MVEGLARSSRFPAFRSRVIVWISLAFPTVLLVAILTSMLAAGSAPVAAEVSLGSACFHLWHWWSGRLLDST